MKKSISKVIAAILICASIAVLISTLLAHFVIKNENINYTNFEVNYAENATISNLFGAPEESITIDFDKTTEINTIAIEENGDVIREFDISYKNLDGEYEFIYKQDVIDVYRYCCFDMVKTTGFKIDILKTKDNANWEIKNISMFLMGKNIDKDFNVTAYVPAQYATDPAKLHKDHFKYINQVNIHGASNFDVDGNVFYPTGLRDNYGNHVDGRLAFEQTLENLRNVVYPNTKIVTTFLGIEDNSPRSQNEIHMGAMRENPQRERLLDGIVDFCKTYGLDGVSFDFEHPVALTQGDEWTVFFDFCKDLKERLIEEVGPGTLLTAAISSWAVTIPLNFDHTCLEGVIDHIELMAYDNFDKNGNHSSFLNDCYQIDSDITIQNKLGLEQMYTNPKIVNLGLPFYSRPTDRRAYWGVYRNVAEELGKFTNFYENEMLDGINRGDNYYNSYQMIYDKTCYWIDRGYGGVMVWNYDCDVEPSNPLSLWGAIGKAIESRS